MIEPEHQYRSGFVTLIGKPNVGKSTFINKLTGQKIAAVSPRPQTTRRKQLGILTLEHAQIIFMDTPGIHKAHHRLGEYMNAVAIDTLEDADVILWMVDASEMPTEEDVRCASHITAISNLPAVLLVMNKIDLLREDELLERKMEYQSLLPGAKPFQLSVTLGSGMDELLEHIIYLLPVGTPFYNEDQITDLYEREVASDLIREAALNHLREEIPHSIAIRIDEYKERTDDRAYIAATIFVEKDSHKGIVIGHGGKMLKNIGASARHEIEEMSGRKIYLELRVKVNKNWRNSPAALSLLGYSKK